MNIKYLCIVISYLVNQILSVALANGTEPDFLPPALDDPKLFFNHTQWTRYILAMPTYNEVTIKPWSGDYWPWRYGGISARYGKMDTRNRNYLSSIAMYSQPSDYLANRNRTDFIDYVNDYYSPAEKYDLLVGDYNFTLTKAHKYYGRKWGGDVPSWMGMCHGLAPASYMVPTPYKAIYVTAADGRTKIQFLPDDIKALATSYWAFADFPNKLTGERQGYMNPVSFYVIIGNAIGRYRLNIAFAPHVDMQIWNFGMSNYTIKYKNIVTKEENQTYTASKVTLEQARAGNDYARSLAKMAPVGTAYMVGVTFTVGYANFMTAKHVEVAPPREIKTATYTMVLYLDDKNQIFYGVWTSRKRPSYVWGPDPHKLVLGPFDAEAPSYGGRVSQLNRLTEYAVKTSGQYMPLRSILYYLARNS
jgi:hypothetical protein